MQKRETLEQRILRAIGNTFVSMNMVNFADNSQQEIKHNPMVSKYVDHTDGADKMMRYAITSLADAETLEQTLEFTDLATAPERLRETDVLSAEFHAVDGHWCRCSFYVMNRGEDGGVLDALFAVQYIDEEKKKELAYSEALKRALENQNEIYAEMLHAGLRRACLSDGFRRSDIHERRGASPVRSVRSGNDAAESAPFDDSGKHRGDILPA